MTRSRTGDLDKSGLAQLRYRDADFEIIRSGSHVICAVSGVRIALEDLLYWNVDLQEGYAGPAEASQRWESLHGKSLHDTGGSGG